MQPTLDTLLDMLTTRRPSGGSTERYFISRYLDPVHGMRRDSYGNRYLDLRDSNCHTAFSAHTDTVHTQEGMQRINVDNGVVSLVAARPKNRKRKRGVVIPAWERDCLGADDAAGVYTLLCLIHAGVPALYLFHRSEEIGGLGSNHIAESTPELLAGIDRCVAIDRRGQTDIITHQMMSRCCSDLFAVALADAIGMAHEPCAYGSFTDTANYTHLVPECTNVSAGYTLEHTSRETLDLGYLECLVARLIEVDYESLPTVRDTRDDSDYRFEHDYIDCQFEFETKNETKKTETDYCSECGELGHDVLCSHAPEFRFYTRKYSRQGRISRGNFDFEG